jgi:hypothetical protein
MARCDVCGSDFAAASLGVLWIGESSKDKDDTTGSKVTSVSSPLPSELDPQSPQLANVSFIMADGLCSAPIARTRCRQLQAEVTSRCF